MMDFGTLYYLLLTYGIVSILWLAARNLIRPPQLTAQANWIPLAIMAASAIAGQIKKHKAGQAEKKQRGLDNDFLKQQDTAKQDIMSRLTAAGFDPYGPQTTTSQQSGTHGSTTNSSTVGEQFVRPEILGNYAGMEGKLRGLVEGRLGKGSPVSDGEIATQLKNINRANAGAEAAVKNVIGSRGLGRAQAGAALTPMQIARTSQITNFLGGIPEIERQRNMENEQQAADLIGKFGTGQRSNMTSNTRSNTSGFSNSQGSQTGGPNIGALMALNMPSGPGQTLDTGQSMFGNVLGGAADLGANIYNYYGNKPITKKPINFGTLRGEGGLY